MKIVELPDSFISAAVKTALEYEGVADLLKLWRDEDDAEERNEIIADIQDLVDDCQRKNKGNYSAVIPRLDRGIQRSCEV